MPDTPDSAFTPPGFTSFRADRCPDQSGKQIGGGICFLINDRWCKDIKMISKSCSSQLETLVINCQPFYSPREFHSIVLVGVYTDPSAPAKDILSQLHDVITKTENLYPNSSIIVTGDFNHINLRKTNPNYYQNITIPTHDSGKTLDQCYTTVKDAYKTITRPRLGVSDHLMLLLIPTYKTKLKQQKPDFKTVKKWTSETSEILQDCFDDTNWDVFRDACSDLDEFTDTVTSYIKFCYDTVVPGKEVKIKGFDKPWFNGDTRVKLEEKLESSKSGDKGLEKKAKYDYIDPSDLRKLNMVKK